MKRHKSLKWINRFQELAEFMEDNLDKWNGIDEIRRSYDEFRFNLKKISELSPELEKDLEPIKTEVEDKHRLLYQKLFPVANILEVYAQDHELGKKAAAMVDHQDKLEKFKSPELCRYAVRIHNLVDKYRQAADAQDIGRYGLSQKMMDELHSACNQLESALQLSKDVRIYRKKVSSELDKLIRLNRKLMKYRLNKLMSVFSGTHPGFYDQYLSLSSGS